VKRAVRFIILWALLLFVGLTLFNFLHECGHGFGAQLDGTHISTGFNQIGDSGKKPSDPNFRSESIETGILDSSGLLGPFTNWMFAILFTILLYKRKQANVLTLIIGTAAVSNALNRLIGVIPFFTGALHNRFRMADEIEWGLKAIKQLNFPMPSDKFMSIANSQPSLILSNPRVYFWPTVSVAISGICFYFAYRKLFRIFKVQLNTKLISWIFGLMPVLMVVGMIITVSKLDNLIRINW
jgi:hypothetical protein